MIKITKDRYLALLKHSNNNVKKTKHGYYRLKYRTPEDRTKMYQRKQPH